MKQRIGIYSPYLNQLGGGELYLLGIAEFFIKHNYQVDLFWPDSEILTQFKQRFNFQLSSAVKIKPFPRGHIQRYRQLKDYDRFFYMTDGSLFFSSCPKSVLIIQAPSHFPAKTLINGLKLKTWLQVWVYSKFVQRQLSKDLNQPSQVVSPFIQLDQFKPGQKQPLILSVGRFFSQPHDKKHQFLIKVFKDLSPRLKDWQLVIAGSLRSEDQSELEKLKSAAEGYPIKILANLDFKQLGQLYGQACLYWHATGYGEDLRRYPAKAEHFGITTLEAMASGAVPVVINNGGLAENVDHGKNGLLWQTEAELKKYTLKLANQPNKREQLVQAGLKKVKQFSKTDFFKQVEKLLI